jgi:hypothetical protein
MCQHIIKDKKQEQKPPNIWLEVDLSGFCPRIWIIGIPKLVLIPKWYSSRRQATQPGRWAQVQIEK